MRLVHGVIRWLNIGAVTAACIVMLLMMAHITLDVGVRYFANGQIVGTLEWVSFYYMVALVFLALGYVEMRNENIRVDLFVQMMPRSVQLALYLLSGVLCLVFFAIMLRQSFLDAWNATLRKETIMSNFIFYIWPSRWALPIGFFGLLIAVLANMLKAIRSGKAL